MLTRALLKRATKVIGIEADAGLLKELEKELEREISEETFESLLADIRTFDIESLPHDYHIVANIPYYLTGDILRRFLAAANQPSTMTLLVQKEVAERIVAKKSARGGSSSGGKESILSLSVKAYGTPKYEFTVPRGAFVPPPKIDSAVLTIRDISRKNFKDAAHEKRFFEYLHAGFGQKRKQLAKNLQNAGLHTPPRLEDVRAEDVPLADWLRYTHPAP
jgi:16S rRNA (adenine1518-N6/adenine1519-N6)-dimethyltransferase